MNHTVKLAYFTDFSEGAKVAFETLMFNIWSFDFQLDLIHILKSNHDSKAFESLETLKREIENSMEDRVTVSIKIFYENEDHKMIEFINQEHYFLTYLPMPTVSFRNGFRTLSHDLYDKLHTDANFVTQSHQVKIENRGIMTLDINNLINLFAIKKYHEYFLFNYAKIKFIIISETPLSPKEMDEAHLFISDTLPRLNFDVINLLHQNRIAGLQKEISENKIDFLIYSQDDSTDQLVNNGINTSLKENAVPFSFMRLHVTPEILGHAISNHPDFQKLSLKDFSASLLS